MACHCSQDAVACIELSFAPLSLPPKNYRCRDCEFVETLEHLLALGGKKLVKVEARFLQRSGCCSKMAPDLPMVASNRDAANEVGASADGLICVCDRARHNPSLTSPLSCPSWRAVTHPFWEVLLVGVGLVLHLSKENIMHSNNHPAELVGQVVLVEPDPIRQRVSKPSLVSWPATPAGPWWRTGSILSLIHI